MSGPRVVVTGLGLATALGLSVEESWRRALAGESAVRSLEGPEAGGAPIKSAGVVAPEDYETIRRAFPEEAAREGERRTLFALWAAREALADAGFAGGSHRAGVALGAGLGVIRLEDVDGWLDASGKYDLPRFAAERDRIHRESLVRNPSDRPAMLIARRHGLGGPNLTVTTACASATQAIGTAARLIRRGEADLVVAGGADSMIHPVGLIYFVLLGAAATSADPPATVCRPFDRRRAGLVMGEGAGMAVLESEAHARARGARVYAELAGYGSSMDGYQVTAPQPQGEGAARAMRAALADAGLAPADIDYINAHGTGTRLNDPAETAAIKAVFGPEAGRVAVSSSKSLIGHLLAACGGPELVFTALSVQRDAIHPTANLTQPDPKCDLDCVPGAARLRPVRAALSNSFGFGGQNGCLVLKKFDTELRNS
jgi:3-oxoacyl-[acyl-carrier-protein] synthase II